MTIKGRELRIDCYTNMMAFIKERYIHNIFEWTWRVSSCTGRGIPVHLDQHESAILIAQTSTAHVTLECAFYPRKQEYTKNIFTIQSLSLVTSNCYTISSTGQQKSRKTFNFGWGSHKFAFIIKSGKYT